MEICTSSNKKIKSNGTRSLTRRERVYTGTRVVISLVHQPLNPGSMLMQSGSLRKGNTETRPFPWLRRVLIGLFLAGPFVFENRIPRLGVACASVNLFWSRKRHSVRSCGAAEIVPIFVSMQKAKLVICLWVA